jgi:hypothetical protein
VKLIVPTIWPSQEGINLIKKEVTILEEVGFSFDHLHKKNIQRFFGSPSSSSINSHLPIVTSHNLVKPSDASCWPTTCGGKKVKQPYIFKLTQ